MVLVDHVVRLGTGDARTNRYRSQTEAFHAIVSGWRSGQPDTVSRGGQGQRKLGVLREAELAGRNRINAQALQHLMPVDPMRRNLDEPVAQKVRGTMDRVGDGGSRHRVDRLIEKAVALRPASMDRPEKDFYLRAGLPIVAIAKSARQVELHPRVSAIEVRQARCQPRRSEYQIGLELQGEILVLSKQGPGRFLYRIERLADRWQERIAGVGQLDLARPPLEQRLSEVFFQ